MKKTPKMGNLIIKNRFLNDLPAMMGVSFKR